MNPEDNTNLPVSSGVRINAGNFEVPAKTPSERANQESMRAMEAIFKEVDSEKANRNIFARIFASVASVLSGRSFPL